MQSAGVQMLGNYFSYRIHSGIFISGISLPLRLFFPFLSCTGLCRLDPPPPPFFLCVGGGFLPVVGSLAGGYVYIYRRLYRVALYFIRLPILVEQTSKEGDVDYGEGEKRS